MPRSTTPLLVSDEDKSTLKAMAECSNPDLSMKARIVLACANPRQLKQIAEELGISVQTVTKWRNAYRDKGLIGIHTDLCIRDRTSPLESKIKELFENKDEDAQWSAAELAAKFHASEQTIYTILHKLDIDLKHPHLHKFTTKDLMGDNYPYLVGLYLSKYTTIAVVSMLDDRLSMQNWTIKGLLYTRDRKLVKLLSISESDVGLADTLAACIEHPLYFGRGQGVSPDEFLNWVMDDWSAASKKGQLKLSVLYYSSHAAALNIRTDSRLQLRQYPTVEDWKANLLYVCNASGFGTITNIKNIGNWLERCEMDADPFVWRMLYSKSGIEQKPAAEKLPGDIGIMTYASFMEAQEAILKQYEADDNSRTEDEHLMLAILLSRGENGEPVYNVVKAPHGMPSLASFDISTPASFEASINSLDTRMSEFAQAVDTAGRSFYLNQVKKKPPGVLVTIDVEYCSHRAQVLVPISVARQLGMEHARFLSADYRQLICEMAVAAPFRKACALFNDARREFSSKVPFRTFVRDVISDGKRLIVAKNMAAEKVLLHFGFNPDTSAYKDGQGLPDELRGSPVDYIDIPGKERRDPFEILKEMNEALDPEKPGLKPPDDSDAADNIRDQHYSEPDTDVIICRKRRRIRKYQPCEDPFEAEKIAVGYVKWFNENCRHESCRILHHWQLEKDIHQELYIAIDAVYVSAQKPTRSSGRKIELPEENKRLSHWNIRVEWDVQRHYRITDADLSKAMCQLLALILANGLYRRHMTVFTDGENCIFTAVGQYLGHWDHDICLDYSHGEKKLFDLLSMAIKGGKRPDPRKEPELFKKGKRKGEIKHQDMIAISRLYARRAASILWSGNLEELIVYLKNIDPADIVNQAALDRLINYFCNKGNYITCYALRARLRLRNSSNGSENTNNVLIAVRQKINAAWLIIGSAGLASLTAIIKNGEDVKWFCENRFSFCLEDNKDEALVEMLEVVLTQFDTITAEDMAKYGPKSTPRPAD